MDLRQLRSFLAVVACGSFGLGVSLVPRMVIRREGGPVYVPLTPPRPSRTLYLAWRRRAALGPAARALRDVVLDRLRHPPR